VRRVSLVDAWVEVVSEQLKPMIGRCRVRYVGSQLVCPETLGASMPSESSCPLDGPYHNRYLPGAVGGGSENPRCVGTPGIPAGLRAAAWCLVLFPPSETRADAHVPRCWMDSYPADWGEYRAEHYYTCVSRCFLVSCPAGLGVWYRDWGEWQCCRAYYQRPELVRPGDPRVPHQKLLVHSPRCCSKKSAR
jgi:hypothetical protein